MRQVKIKAIRKLDKKNDRYDLTVPQNHNFFANGVLIHNTSGRTGNILADEQLKGLKGWLHRKLGLFTPKKKWQVVTGTRRVVLDPDSTVDAGYYSGKTFRVDIHKMFVDAEIPKGLTFFYEIVGYSEDMTTIMPRQSIDKIGDKKLRKEVKKLYGDTMTFTYGCHAGQPYKVMVYRVTMSSPDDEVVELPWPQVKEVCKRFGFETVPELRNTFFYAGKHIEDPRMDDDFHRGLSVSNADSKDLAHRVEHFLDKPSSVDASHIREGVCVRAEMPDGTTKIMKDKGYLFKVLEGIVKNNPDTVDIEEVECLHDILE